MHPIVRTAALVIGLAAPGALGACGDDDAGSSAQRTGTRGFPVTVERKFGSTQIPARPARVVTVGYTEQDAVLALGVTPVGVREFLGATTGGSAPGRRRRWTVAQTGEHIDFGMPWQEQTLMIGRALGRAERARKIVEQVQARFAQARERYPEFDGATAILAYGGSDGYGAYASQDTRSRFFADLGFQTPPKVDALAGEGFFVEFSQERFRLMDQDVVVMFGKREDVIGNPVFRRLDAVREDRVIYLDLEDQLAGALGFSSALSLPFLLDEAAPRLAAAVDGDPETEVEQPR